jgi:hypothetical protein
LVYEHKYERGHQHKYLLLDSRHTLFIDSLFALLSAASPTRVITTHTHCRMDLGTLKPTQHAPITTGRAASSPPKPQSPNPRNWSSAAETELGMPSPVPSQSIRESVGSGKMSDGNVGSLDVGWLLHSKKGE